MNLKGMKLDLPTIILGVYFVYALTSVGMTGLLFSVAVGLILYGLVDRFELLVAGVVLSGIFWKVYLSKAFGFRTEGFVGGSPAEISKRIQTIQRESRALGPVGLGTSFAEGFADANAPPQDAGSQSAPKQDTPPSPESAPAPTTAPTATKQLEKALPAPPPAPPAEPKKETFNNPGPQPFKLELPEETKGGFHIDAGTTIMNALKNLKPEQIEAMTADTQNLISTQKSLMGMLQTMKPMLNDGKQLMETFQQMFGK